MSRKFSEAVYNEQSNLLIVDGLNLAFRYKYANQKVFSEKYISTVLSLANSYDAKDIIVLGDGGSTYRKNIFPEYKGNRDEMRAKQTPEEEQNFKEFLEEFNKTFIDISGVASTFRFYGVEADDIAAYIVNNYFKFYNHIWLISSDKDWDLLIKDNVSRFSFVTRKEIKLDNWEEHYDYPQEAHISIKVLMGDKGDNIPGVEGIGITRAKNLVKEYGSAYDILSSLPLNKTSKYILNLNNFGDNILRNYELMDLETYCEDALGEENKKIIDDYFEEKTK